jgi:hypothetical protein
VELIRTKISQLSYSVGMSYITDSLDDPKQLHVFLFELYDFAYLLSTKMLDTNKPYATEASFYPFMVYIEDIMDSYGRQLILESAKDANLDAEESLKEAHARLDTLREMLNNLKELPPVVDAVDEASKRIKNNWGTRE